MQAIEQRDLKIKDLERPTPIDQESLFKIEELFFSITDPKSNILFANDVFIRISKYDEEEIIGQLHKLIRHPDMPRSVFYVFWEYLLAKKPVAAYVKNMAKDGSYYWVMALAFPCPKGFLSIRLKPGSALFKKVKGIYESTLKHEQSSETSSDKRAAMLAGKDHFLQQLKKAGFHDYQEFMWNALQSEMAEREKHITSKRKITGDTIPVELLDLDELLHELVLSLEKLKDIHQALMSHSDYILNLARSILLLSLNAQVGSAKLDKDDQSLSVVAEKMGEQSVMGEKKLIHMKSDIQKLSNLIGTLNFEIVSSKLQVEMTIDYLKEVEGKKNHEFISLTSPEETVELLYGTFKPNIKTIADGLANIPKHLSNLLAGVKSIERFLMVLRFIHITGKVEVARMNDSENSFATTFQELVSEIETAESHLKELSDVLNNNTDNIDKYYQINEKLARLMATLNNK